MSEVLQRVREPRDVKGLAAGELPQLAAELRQRIIGTVSRTGGHLASNLGAVELTIALMRVFDPPVDKVVWDVGHQCYSWKLMTGRQDRFETLRQRGGISGFPKPSESEYDTFVAGHAGTALSSALGLAVGRDRAGRGGHVVAIVGDAAMANGIALEALNNISETGSKLIVILNDNEMSISENVGAMSRHLGRLLASKRYNRIKAAAESVGHKLRMTPLRRVYHRMEQAVKSLWLRNAFFEEFGLRYVGPINGHDFRELESALCSARDDKRSVVLHVATRKGMGFEPAETSPCDWHGVGAFNLDGSVAGGSRGGPGYSKILGESLSTMAESDERLVAITAAMSAGTGLEGFGERFPERFFDVGICEEHAVVFAAGLATAGYRPVFAVYSTFLQRAVDCVMHDLCLQKLPVVLCIDRAGVVGADGPTHHGIYDIAMLRTLPNLVMMQPKDGRELAAMLKSAVAVDGPVSIRYPREPGPVVDYAGGIEPLEIGRGEVVSELAGGAEEGTSEELWLWALGDMVPLAEEVARELRGRGYRVGVVNARFIKPLDSGLLWQQAASGCRRFVTIENGAVMGGFGSALREALVAGGYQGVVQSFGWPDSFVGQGSTEELKRDYGLTPEAIAHEVVKWGAGD